MTQAQLIHEAKLEVFSLLSADFRLHYELGVHERHSVNVKAELRRNNRVISEIDTNPLNYIEVANFRHWETEFGLEYRYYIIPKHGLDRLYVGAGYLQTIDLGFEEGYEDFYEAYYGRPFKDYTTQDFLVGFTTGYKYLWKERWVVDAELSFLANKTYEDNPDIPMNERSMLAPTYRVHLFIGYRF